MPEFHFSNTKGIEGLNKKLQNFQVFWESSGFGDAKQEYNALNLH